VRGGRKGRGQRKLSSLDEGNEEEFDTYTDGEEGDGLVDSAERQSDEEREGSATRGSSELLKGGCGELTVGGARHRQPVVERFRRIRFG